MITKDCLIKERFHKIYFDSPPSPKTMGILLLNAIILGSDKIIWAEYLSFSSFNVAMYLKFKFEISG